MTTKEKAMHTPGPWSYQATAGNHDFLVYSEAQPDKGDVAIVRDFDEANARLIAAAPQLLDALSDLMKSCQNWAPTIDRSRAEAAIRAAKGE